MHTLCVDFYVIPGAFYYTFGNIRPEMRSHMNAIQLLGLINAKHLKEYGAGAMLAPFMADVKLLEHVCNSCNHNRPHGKISIFHFCSITKLVCQILTCGRHRILQPITRTAYYPHPLNFAWKNNFVARLPAPPDNSRVKSSPGLARTVDGTCVEIKANH